MNARFLAHWLTTAAALGVTAWLLPGVEVTSLAALAVAALVLGLVLVVMLVIWVFRENQAAKADQLQQTRAPQLLGGGSPNWPAYP